DDVREDTAKEFYRLAPGREVRLRYAYYVKCVDVVKDKDGNVIELHCTYDPKTRGGDSPDGRKVKATLHWVSANHCIEGEVRLYDRLFKTADPDEGGDFLKNLNPDSLKVLTGCKLEPALKNVKPEEFFQFERLGYFSVDKDSKPEKLIFNRSVTIKDTWAKIEARLKQR
ncbi:MAG: glutamine--tRNA ligase, partial [candidate division WOR-3 bacterium]